MGMSMERGAESRGARCKQTGSASEIGMKVMKGRKDGKLC